MSDAKSEGAVRKLLFNNIMENDVQKVERVCTENGININAPKEHGITPLMWAAYCDSIDVVAFLLTNKADLNAKSGKGETALDIAKRSKSEDVVKLLNKDAKLDRPRGSHPESSRSESVLPVSQGPFPGEQKELFSGGFGHPGSQKRLVDAGVDIDITAPPFSPSLPFKVAAANKRDVSFFSRLLADHSSDISAPAEESRDSVCSLS